MGVYSGRGLARHFAPIAVTYLYPDLARFDRIKFQPPLLVSASSSHATFMAASLSPCDTCRSERGGDLSLPPPPPPVPNQHSYRVTS